MRLRRMKVPVYNIAGVRLSPRQLWRLRQRLDEWVEVALSLLDRPVDPEWVERKYRTELERVLSLHAGRSVTLTDRAWEGWRETFCPDWRVREILARQASGF